MQNQRNNPQKDSNGFFRIAFIQYTSFANESDLEALDKCLLMVPLMVDSMFMHYRSTKEMDVEEAKDNFRNALYEALCRQRNIPTFWGFLKFIDRIYYGVLSGASDRYASRKIAEREYFCRHFVPERSRLPRYNGSFELFLKYELRPVLVQAIKKTAAKRFVTRTTRRQFVAMTLDYLRNDLRKRKAYGIRNMEQYRNLLTIMVINLRVLIKQAREVTSCDLVGQEYGSILFDYYYTGGDVAYEGFEES